MDTLSVDSSLTDNTLVSTVTVPRRLEKYFHSLKMVASYDVPLRANRSILSIPFVSNILPLAWLTGTDVHVETLDRTYVEAMTAIKHEFNLMYPRGEFKTKITSDDLVENQTDSQETACLFSGGVDSTYSLISNISLKPRLIMYSGVQHYQLNPSYTKHQQLVKTTYSAFAKRQGLPINFIETNIISTLNDSRISHDFHKILRETGLWLALQFPLVLLGLPAPLSFGRFNRLLIAASVDPKHDYDKYPHSSQPRIDEKFAWANVKVTHDGYIHRFKKTHLIKEFLNENRIDLNVCNRPPLNKLNCSACEKCYRTIAPLVLEGVDPNVCGFSVDKSTFKSMKRMLERKKTDALVVDSFWKELQALVKPDMESDRFDSKDLFLWLKNLDMDSVRKRRNYYQDIFNVLPYPLSLSFDKFFKLVRKPRVQK